MKFLATFLAVSFAACTLAETAKIKNSHSDPRYGAPIEFSKVEGTKGTMALEISGENFTPSKITGFRCTIFLPQNSLKK